jgi:lipopolysaccharide/colanic/teichoic acid biosynthesis glycosyltransferase
MAKRTFDVIVAALALLVLSPLMLAISLAIRWTSPGPVLFRQTRMGRGLKPFEILKFRTMVVDADKLGLPLTAGGDPRITPLGRLLRKSKLDELPQLINVIKGDMSIVGPRPEVPKYVELFRQEFEQILTLRPGLTDLASIKYRDESALLAAAADPEHEYQTRVLPDKLELAKEYVERSSLWLDLWLILRTIARLLSCSS